MWPNKLLLPIFILLLHLLPKIFRKDVRVKAEFIPPHIVVQQQEENPNYPILPNSRSLLLKISTPNSNKKAFLVISPSISNDQPISAYSSHSTVEIEENNNGIVEGRKLNSIENIDEERFKLMAPYTWRVILGGICQLPNFRRPTENENSFAECMPINEKDTLTRNDLGIWRLRKCPIRTAFVPSAQICLPEETIRLQNLMCSSTTADENKNNDKLIDEVKGQKNINGCPPKNRSEIWITNRKKYSLPTNCRENEAESKEKCPQQNSFRKRKEDENDENEWEEMEVELLEPCPIPTEERLRRQFGHSSLPPCPCPPQRTNCICVQPQTQQPQMFMDCCCVEKQIPPCLCTPIHDQKPIVSPPPPPPLNSLQQQPFQSPPPHLLETNSGQTFRVEIHQFNQPQPNSMQGQNNFWNQRNPYGQGPLNPTGQNAINPNLHGENIHGIGAATGNGIGQELSTINAPQPCPLVEPNSIANAHYQALCSWMLDPLAADPESRNHFLQCQPAPFNLFCGRWQRMPCAPKTVFEQREQICIWDMGGGAQLPGVNGNGIGPSAGSGWNQPRIGNFGNTQENNGPNGALPSFIIPGRKVLECNCQCRNDQIPLGSCSPQMRCPAPAVCQTGLITPQISYDSSKSLALKRPALKRPPSQKGDKNF